jgi:hypothetical protein
VADGSHVEPPPPAGFVPPPAAPVLGELRATADVDRWECWTGRDWESVPPRVLPLLTKGAPIHRVDRILDARKAALAAAARVVMRPATGADVVALAAQLEKWLLRADPEPRQ